jgi:hypothetical protein
VNGRRKSLSALTGDVGNVPEIPVRTEPEPAPEPDAAAATATPPPMSAQGEQAVPEPRRPARPRRSTKRPPARELITPARQPMAREALKVDVPAELELLHRLRAYRLATGQDIRDTAALALDEWLTREGY